MDAFEPGNFYGDLHPATPRPVQEIYLNATGGAKGQASYESEYRARYPQATTMNGLRSSISGLQAQLVTVNKKVCPKETVGKAIITGGIANIAARNCRREQEAKRNALGNLINTYTETLNGMILEEQTQKQIKDEEEKLAKMPPLTEPFTTNDTTQYGGVGPMGGNKMLLYGIVGVGVVIAVIFAVKSMKQ